MVQKQEKSWLYIVGIVLAVLFIVVALHDVMEAPETVTVTETVVETVEVQSECAVCEVCVECNVTEEVVCPEVDEDLLEEQAVKDEVQELVAGLLEDEDFIEDDLIDFLESEYGLEITDEDDILSLEIEEVDVDWDVEDEEGSYEIEVEVHFYAEDSREDYYSRDFALVGEFDEDSLEDMLDEEELEDYELIDA